MNSFNFSEFEKNFFYLPKIIKKNQMNLIKENNVKNFIILIKKIIINII